jgi:tetrahydromethanopterin S-methyltransferase subunit H
MFDYSVNQKTYEISGIKVGGIPGLAPTVMVGSMFYNGHTVVKNAAKGLFNKIEAEKQLRKAEETSDMTGLPTMVDLIAENSQAAANYLDFMVDITELPLLLDIVSESAQTESLDYINEQGMMDRIIFNSLNPHSKEAIYKKLKEVQCNNAILLLHSTKYILSSNKDALLQEMIPKAQEAGISNILVDTVVIDIPTLGLAVKSIDDIKNKYGYPCGCGAHNALSSWKRLHEKYCTRAVTTVLGVINALPIAIGADFVFYGPIRNAESIYPSIAMINAAYSQQLMEKRFRVDKNHPRYKIG